MALTTLTLVTIIAESVLEADITVALKQYGARGYTVTESRGEGSRGLRASELPGQNVRIESVVSEEVATRVMEHLAKQYFANYAVICFTNPVQVLRGDKYV